MQSVAKQRKLRRESRYITGLDTKNARKDF